MSVRKFILQVKNIKQCPGGYSCNLVANGRRVAYIAPEIFEWSSHGIMVDVLEFYGNKLKLADVGPTELEEGWMEKESRLDKKEIMQTEAQSRLCNWVNKNISSYVKAKALKDKCKETVLVFCVISKSIIDWHMPPSKAKISSPATKSFLSLSDKNILLNGLSVEEIANLL